MTTTVNVTTLSGSGTGSLDSVLASGSADAILATTLSGGMLLVTPPITISGSDTIDGGAPSDVITIAASPGTSQLFVSSVTGSTNVKFTNGQFSLIGDGSSFFGNVSIDAGASLTVASSNPVTYTLVTPSSSMPGATLTGTLAALNNATISGLKLGNFIDITDHSASGVTTTLTGGNTLSLVDSSNATIGTFLEADSGVGPFATLSDGNGGLFLTGAVSVTTTDDTAASGNLKTGLQTITNSVGPGGEAVLKFTSTLGSAITTSGSAFTLPSARVDFEVTGSNTDTISASLTGGAGGIQKSSTGTLSLVGDQSLFTGPVYISGGLLDLSGVTSLNAATSLNFLSRNAVIEGSGAVLGGHSISGFKIGDEIVLSNFPHGSVTAQRVLTTSLDGSSNVVVTLHDGIAPDAILTFAPGTVGSGQIFSVADFGTAGSRIVLAESVSSSSLTAATDLAGAVTALSSLGLSHANDAIVDFGSTGGSAFTLSSAIAMPSAGLELRVRNGTISGANGTILSDTSNLNGVTINAGATGGFTGSGNFIKGGSGLLDLVGHNSFTGTVEESGGTLMVDANALNNNALKIYDGSILDFNQATSASYSGSITSGGQGDPNNINGGAFVKDGVGTLSLTGSFAGFTGTYAVNSGTLDISGASAIPSSAHVALGAGTTLVLTSAEAGQLTATQLAVGAVLQFTDSIGNDSHLVNQGGSFGADTLLFAALGTNATPKQETVTGLIFGGATGALATVSGTAFPDPISIQNASDSPSGFFLSNNAVLELSPSGGAETYGGSFSGSGTVMSFGGQNIALTGSLSGFTGTLSVSGGTRLELDETVIGAGIGIAMSPNTTPIPTLAGSAAGLNGHTVTGAGVGYVIDLIDASSASFSSNGSNATISGVDTVLGGGAYNIVLAGYGGIANVTTDGAGGEKITLAANPFQVTSAAASGIGSLSSVTGSMSVPGVVAISSSLAFQTIQGAATLPAGSAIITPGPSVLSYTLGGQLTSSGGIIKSGGGTLNLPTTEAIGGVVSVQGGGLNITGSGLRNFDLTNSVSATIMGTAAALGTDTINGDPLTGAAAGSGIDITDFTHPSKTTVSYNSSTHQATVTDNSTAQSVVVNLPGTSGTPTLAVLRDSVGGTLVLPTQQVTTGTDLSNDLTNVATTGGSFSLISFAGSNSFAPGTLTLPTGTVDFYTGITSTFGVGNNVTIGSGMQGITGFVKSGAGSLALTGNETVTGAVTLGGGVLDISGSTGLQSFDFSNSSNATLAGTVASLNNIKFSGGGHPESQGDAVDIKDLIHPGKTTAVFTSSGNDAILTITDTKASTSVAVTLVGGISSGEGVAVLRDGTGGTLIKPAIQVTPTVSGGLASAFGTISSADAVNDAITFANSGVVSFSSLVLPSNGVLIDTENVATATGNSITLSGALSLASSGAPQLTKVGKGVLALAGNETGLFPGGEGNAIQVNGGILDLTGAVTLAASQSLSLSSTGGAEIRTTSANLTGHGITIFGFGDSIDAVDIGGAAPSLAFASTGGSSYSLVGSAHSATGSLSTSGINTLPVLLPDFAGGTQIVASYQVTTSGSSGSGSLFDALQQADSLPGSAVGVITFLPNETITSGGALPTGNSGLGVTWFDAQTGEVDEIAGPLTAGGFTKVGGGTLMLANDLSGLTGTIVANGGTLDLSPGFGLNLGASLSLGFGVGSATIKGTLAEFASHTIGGVLSGDAIDLADVSISGSPTITSSAGVLSIVASGKSNSTIALPGSTTSFHLGGDGAGGTLITFGAVVAPPATSGGGGLPKSNFTDPTLLNSGTPGAPVVINLSGSGSTEVTLPTGTPLDLTNAQFSTGGAATPVVLFDTVGGAHITLPGTVPDNGQPLEFVAMAGSNSIAGGAARVNIFGGPGNDTISLGSGGGEIIGGAGTAAINGGNAGTGFGDPGAAIIVGATLGGSISVAGNGAIVEGGSGAATETLTGAVPSGGSQFLVGSSNAGAHDTIQSSGTSTSGSATVMFALAGAGQTLFTSTGTEEDVVFGTSGPLSVNGGNGTLLMKASTGATLVNTDGATADIFGNSSGTLTVNGGSGAVFVVGNSANTIGMTVNMSSVGGGAATVFGDGGFDTVVLGTGGGIVVAGAVGGTFTAGAGTSVFFAGGAASDTFIVPHLIGSPPVDGFPRGGNGPFFNVIAPTSTMTDIVGFRSGTDHLDLRQFGFAGSNLPAMLATTDTVDGVAGVPVLELNLGNNQFIDMVGLTTLTGADLVASVITGTSGNDSLIGTPAADSITGGGGTDTISSGGGNDTIDISGGAVSPGPDSVVTGSGNDLIKVSTAELSTAPTIVGGGGNDTLEVVDSGSISSAAFAHTTGIGIVQFDGTMTGTLFVSDAMVSAENGSLQFNATNGAALNLDLSGVGSTVGSNSVGVLGDTVTGASDTVTVGGGHEGINLGLGDDIAVVNATTLASGTLTLSGGANPVDGTGDTLSITGGGTMTIGASVSHFETVALGNDALTSLTLSNAFVSSADPISGTVTGVVNVSMGAFASPITIDASQLTSGRVSVNASTTTGSVTFKAGAGADTFEGGTGPDSFAFGTGASASTPGSAALITDFGHGVDHIDLTALVLTAHTINTTTVTAPTGVAGEFNGNGVLQVQSAGTPTETDLYVDANKDGKFDTGDFIIRVGGNTVSFAANDFLFIPT